MTYECYEDGILYKIFEDDEQAGKWLAARKIANSSGIFQIMEVDDSGAVDQHYIEKIGKAGKTEKEMQRLYVAVHETAVKKAQEGKIDTRVKKLYYCGDYDENSLISLKYYVDIVNAAAGKIIAITATGPETGTIVYSLPVDVSDGDEKD
ncbi:MAG: hypothetical protein LBQ97_09655 [Fusobacteriaceae bacterium]|jgi:hypothetical protein|nr:hypothetical protein [Fusobacteriaceae bacterium]